MGFLSKLWVEIGLKSDEFSKGLNKASASTKSFSNQAGKLIGSTIAKFTSLTAAVALVGRAIKEAVNTIMEFERANSTLASILGSNKKDIADMAQAAMDLGRRTEFTSTQVTQLQTELAKLGFSKEQIKASEEAILKFAAAVDTDLASAASFAGGVLRSFGYEAEQMPDLLNVMAAACTNTALDFNKLSVGLPIVSAAAAAFGMDVKQVSALLGVLANKGIDASTAATSLRNIFLDAAQSNSKLAAATGMSLKTYEDVFKALKKLSDQGGDLTTIAGAGTVRTATQIAALSSSTDTIRELEEVFAHCGGTLDKMYTEKVDNAVGATKSLASAWEGLILTLRGVDNPIKKAKEALAQLLNGITDFINSPFWESKFWNGWKKGMQGAASVTTTAFGPVLTLLNRVRDVMGRIKDQTKDIQVPDSYDIVFGENDPNFIGPVLKKNTPSTASAYDAAKDPVHKAIKEQIDQMWLDNAQFDKVLQDRAETTAQLAGWADVAMPSLTAQAVPLTESLAGADARLQSIGDEAEKASIRIEKMQYAAESLAYSLQDGLIGALDELANVIAGVDGSDMRSVARALLSPLADMAVQAGLMIMSTGSAVEALKTALTSLSGPVAIAAGAALMAIGVAMKAGMAALAKGGSSAAGTATSSAYGNTASNVSENMEMTIRIEGKLKGSDIVLAGQRTEAAWAR